MSKSQKFQAMRRILIEHLNYSFIEDVNVDYYTELALWVLSLSNHSHNDFNVLDNDLLITKVEESSYLNEMYKQQAMYIARMLLNIKYDCRSPSAKNIVAICDCGGRCILESNSLNQRNNRRTGLIYQRCTGCGKSASVHKGDMWPSGNFVNSVFRIELLGIHAMINRICAELNINKRQLYLKVGNKIRSSESVCHVGLISPGNLSVYRDALLAISPKN